MNKVSWRSPSNIALIKYWGKHGYQLPKNPSLSFTLSECHTTTELEWVPGNGKIQVFYDNEQKEKFTARARDFVSSVVDIFPFLIDYDLHFNSVNSFPHSAGIASSASAMSSVALCLCSMEESLTGKEIPSPEFFRKASHVARLGSGSASRSLYGGYVSWGKSANLPGSSDKYASPLPFDIHESYMDMRDTVLIVDQGIKAVSSREGHYLMNRHPYASNRYEQANKNFNTLLKALKKGNDAAFIKVVESEALGLHALMMSSTPPYILLRANTIKIINRIRAFRELSCTTLCYTLDAGPNVHLLFHDRDKAEVEEFISEELLLYCQDNYRIDNHIGEGPVKVEIRE